MAKRFWFSHIIAEKLFPDLMDSYGNGTGFFKEREKLFPEMPLPNGIEWASPEHFNWWFVTTMMDHAVVSRLHYHRSRLLYEAIQEDGTPNIFDPNIAAPLDESEIYRQLLRMCFGANNHPSALKENSRRIVTEYGGNPKNVFEDGGCIQEAKKELMTFDHYARGTAGLLLTFLQKYSLVEFENPEDLIVKVDHHDIRVLETAGVVNLRENDISDDEIAYPLADFMRKKCKQLDIDVITLDSILWAIGVYGCTAKNLSVCETGCPVYGECEQEKMLGSYYKDGRLWKGDYWRPETLKQQRAKREQLILPLELEERVVDFIPEINMRLSELKDG